MTRSGRQRYEAAIVVATMLLPLCQPTPSRAACSTIPVPPESFRGVRGRIDRPFVIPGDFGGPKDNGGKVTLLLDGCQPGVDFDKEEHVVSIVFTPPSGPRNVLLLAADCTGLESTCQSQLSGGVAKCNETTLHVTGTGANKNRQMWFDVPEPTSVPGMPDVAGSAVVVVTNKTELRCDLGDATTPTCKDDTQAPQPLLCIDDFYVDPGCGSSFANPVFGNFTFLPELNDFKELCKDKGAAPNCQLDDTKSVRFAIDKRGNVLLPVDWRGVLRGQGGGGAPCKDDESCDTRALRATTRVDPFPDNPNHDVIEIPGGQVRSFSVRGAQFVPPPEITVSVTNPGPPPDDSELLLEGEAHKRKSVLRFPSCDESKSPCVANTLFDFRDRLANQVGPVAIPRKGGPGICDEPNGQKCKSDADCASGVVCAGFRAQALGQTPGPAPTMTPPPVVTATAPMAPPPPGFSAGTLIVGVVVGFLLAVVLLGFARRRR